MISKKIIMISTMLIASAMPVAHAQPESFLGKLGASCLQIARKHPAIVSAIPYAIAEWHYFTTEPIPQLDGKPLFIALAWLFTVPLTRTTAQVLMEQFDIDPIE